MGKNSANQPGVKELAAAAGVSSATISRVFNQHAYVSEDVRKRVLELARQIGYAPAISSSCNLFGVLVSNKNTLFQDYSQKVLISFINEMQNNGCNVQIFNHNYFPYILRKTFRGVLVFHHKYADFFQNNNIPFVVINDYKENSWNVITDHEESTRIAVEYLLKKGHRRIAYLGGAFTTWGCNERRRGYRNAMLSAGMKESDLIISSFTSDCSSIYDEIGKLLENKSMTALIVEGEEYGIIVDHALKSRGVRIPDDISLITFESGKYSRFLYPAHTTVVQDFDGLGKAAAKTLLAQTKHSGRLKQKPITQMLFNRIIERDSCRIIE